MTKDKIIAAAMALFAKNGYEGTALSDIAKEVGIRKPSIYNHFKSKEEIFLKIYEDILWLHVKKIEKLMDEIKDHPPKDQLYQILMLTCQYYLDYQEQSTFLNRATFFAPEGLKEEIQNQFMAAEEKMSEILRKILNEGMESKEIREGNIEDFIMSFYCLIDGIFIEFSYYGAEKMIPRIPNIWKNFWYGLKND
ncbi:TetR/AcrR family transcriptional regulator [Neobacillus sp. DY30]|uniref:TetR/AcrR family transcriptional regulator n=1 Tax=Neobacillus sp. DY30 TaxID=3047871 RepID=UPI0024BF2E0D|nr:TetR/AcrR family transcriptional regulator [Neobacillus sp. DY30]WHY02530.1 TetR/AcrR family transcriptional regulator [Neobacillus sp. DY30]